MGRDGVQDREQKWSEDMRAAQRGCAASYVRLLSEVADWLSSAIRRECRRVGIGDGDVDDVVQETLLAIHLKRHTWDGQRSFLPWVHAIARYKLVDMARRRGRAAEVPLDGVIESMASPEPAPEPMFAVDRVLQNLPLRQREVVQALAVEGASVRETASRLRISTGAVYVSLHRALTALALKSGEGSW
jgi:RNA polymerase sigma-70 factor (ECF subfamily)